MNEDILQGKWNQLRGQIKAWWGEITDDDLDRIEGNAERLAGVLQERYGYTREQAESELEAFLEQTKLREY